MKLKCGLGRSCEGLIGFADGEVLQLSGYMPGRTRKGRQRVDCCGRMLVICSIILCAKIAMDIRVRLSRAKRLLFVSLAKVQA